MSTSDDVIVVEFFAARVTIRRVVELVLLVRGQFHGFLFVKNFANFLQFRTHVPVKMLHRVEPAINVRGFVLVLGVFVLSYAEATKSARDVNFAIVFISGFYEIAFEVEIKTNRTKNGFRKFLKQTLLLSFLTSYGEES